MCMSGCMYVCMYVCMYICLFVYVYVCMYVCVLYENLPAWCCVKGQEEEEGGGGREGGREGSITIEARALSMAGGERIGEGRENTACITSDKNTSVSS